jgi:hypothetical protein
VITSWNNVAKGLPKLNREVLVWADGYGAGGEGSGPTVGFYDKGNSAWRDANSGARIVVSHWVAFARPNAEGGGT